MNELILWCDYARRENNDKDWNPKKFAFDAEISQLPYLRARQTNHRAQKEINQFIFFDADQPMQPNEFYNDNKDRINGIIDSYSCSPRMEHKYSTDRVPIWRDDFEFFT